MISTNFSTVVCSVCSRDYFDYENYHYIVNFLLFYEVGRHN
jgi:hypothetical protein